MTRFSTIGSTAARSARRVGRVMSYLWVCLVLAGFLQSAAVAAPGPKPVPEPAPAAGRPSAPEQDVKAAFLYNFAQLVEWPSEVPIPKALSVGVWGDADLARRVARVIDGKPAQGQPVEVRVVSELSDLEGCQILLFSSGQTTGLEQALELVRDAPILTVGESDLFSELGGIIRFKIVDNRVRFEINVGSAERSGLKVSSRLLRVAEIVGHSSGRGR